MDKKTLLLCCFTTLFLVSCGGDPQRSAYVSNCLGDTPGGSSFKELCECSYDKGVESLTSDELKAFKRDFSEVEDMQYAYSVPMKMTAATMECVGVDLD